MKKSVASIIIILSVSMLCACAAKTEKDADIAVSDEIALDQKAESDSGVEAITEMEVTNGTEAAEQENEEMRGGLEDYANIEVTGVDIDSLTEEQMEILLLQARYCQAMTDTDTDTMRGLVSEDMTYTHMSGKTQTREEYFADIEKGRLNYFTIGIENPVIEVDGDTATIEYTSVLNANAYGARGTFRISGIHHYEKRDGSWILVNR